MVLDKRWTHLSRLYYIVNDVQSLVSWCYYGWNEVKRAWGNNFGVWWNPFHITLSVVLVLFGWEWHVVLERMILLVLLLCIYFLGCPHTPPILLALFWTWSYMFRLRKQGTSCKMTKKAQVNEFIIFDFNRTTHKSNLSLIKCLDINLFR